MTFIDLLILAYFVALAGLMVFLIGRAHYAWKPLLILLVLSGAVLMIWYPGHYGPRDRLNRGLDLAGGTTLIYEVRLAEDANTDEVIPNLISVLRDRVDPQGVRNLAWRQIAGNRIQIQMPLAPPETQALRAEYLDARDELLEAGLSTPALDRALRAEPGEARQQELDRLASPGSDLRTELEELVQAYDAFIAASEPYEQTQQALREAEQALADLPEDAPEGQRAELEAGVNRIEQQIQAEAEAYLEAREHYQQLRERVLAHNISPAELDRALNQPASARMPGDPSPRGQAKQRLLDQHPDRAAQIERVFELHAAYEQRKGPLDSPEDLIAMLQGSGVLEFRIGATPGGEPANVAEYREQLEEQGPRAGRTRPWRWFPIDDVDQFAADSEQKEQLASNPQAFFTDYGLVGQEYGGEYYVLLANTDPLALTRDDPDWELTNAYRTTDQLGGSALGFSLNAPGGRMMGQLTGPNRGKPMAILLDNQVISAPQLNPNTGRITDSGQITGGQGGFTQQEMSYLLRTLQAGSAAAELAEEPSMVKTTGPSLGQDNLHAGMEAAILSLIAVGVFILAYYFFAGAVANFALVANMILILGIMAMFQATFTLPGIAGIVLTIGMAVDANVLIFERIREERERDVDLPTAVRLGFEKALSTIVDANVTTLLTCVVLYYFATAEIKGFAVTLLVGILATLFTALFCTRTILELYLRWGHPRELHMLPMIVPAIRRALSPNVDWIGKRYGFFTISAILVVGGLLAVYSRGASMLDIEFRSGTAVSVELAEGETLSIEEARQRLTLHAEVAEAVAAGGLNDPSELPASLREQYGDVDLNEVFRDVQPIVSGEDDGAVDFSHLRGDRATVVTTGATQGMEASGFNISTLVTDSDVVSEMVQAAFEDKLEVTRSITFEGAAIEDVAQAPVYPVRDSDLGRNIDRFGSASDFNVSDYLGGVAIVLEDMNPVPTLDELRQRIRRTSMQPEFEGLGYRAFEVFGLERAMDAEGGGDEPRYATAVVVARDNATSYVDDPDAFTASQGLAQTQWDLVSTALDRGSSLSSVSNFSSQVSQTMQQQAISALILALLGVVAYIWFRFGSIHYGLAAIVALVHDVLIALGLLAMAGYIYDTWLGGLLLLDSFKIDLAIIAAMLTIVGYSLNDTIVIFDRIRENRGRLAVATPGIINDSINQTISRTALTSGTTLLAVGILYIFGGSGIHGFAFAVLIGVIVGTYSSIGIGAPVLLLGRAHRQAAVREAERKAREGGAAPAAS